MCLKTPENGFKSQQGHVKERRSPFSLIYFEALTYPRMVITMGLCSPDLTPIALAQSNFWALHESPRASYLIMNRERVEELSVSSWLLETHILGQSSLSKSVLLGSPEIIRIGVDEWGQGRENKTKEKNIKSPGVFQSSEDGYKLPLSN